MIRFRPLLTACGFALLAAGCAASFKSVAPGAPGRVFVGSYDQIWDAALQAVMEGGYELEAANRPHGAILATKSYPPEKIREYALGVESYLTARWWKLREELIVSVQPMDDGQGRVAAESRLTGEASTMDLDTNSGWTEIPLRSTGTAEATYLDLAGLALEHAQRLNSP